MHKFLRSIGFSGIKTNKELNKLLNLTTSLADTKMYAENGEDIVAAEYYKEFGENMGLIVRGEYDENNDFQSSYYFPVLKGYGITSTEDISIERQAEKEAYAGVCDDVKVGVTLIFYLQNMIPYIKYKNTNMLPIRGTTLTLSALASQGTIMMPIVKNESDVARGKQVASNRNRLIAQARSGDESAMESLTLEDMDTYTHISKKLRTEDVFTIVDTFFMPYGVECDQYSIMGEIQAVRTVINPYTEEKVYQMTLLCNELQFDVCINAEDLLGEPMEGRRFKGLVWMQGYINYPEMISE